MILRKSFVLSGIAIFVTFSGLIAGCALTPIDQSNRETALNPHVLSSTLLPLTLLTPQSTEPLPAFSIPIHLEFPNQERLIGVDSADGSLEALSLSVSRALHWTQFPPIQHSGTTIILGFDTAPVFDVLPQLQPGDVVIVTDQYGRKYLYRVERRTQSDAFQTSLKTLPDGVAIALIGVPLGNGSSIKVILRPAGK